MALLIAHTSFAQTAPAASAKPHERLHQKVHNKRHHKKQKVSKAAKSLRPDKYKGYTVTKIPDYKIPPLLSREDLNKLIPSGVNSTAPSGQVLQKIGHKDVNVWLNQH